jgi:putative Holliday junction resolvase
MSKGRIAAIDFGTVRIGIAITDPEQRIASPYENYTRRGLHADRERFRRLAKDEEVKLFVVGLPLHISGDESRKSQEARQFGQWLQDTTGVPVVFFDERYTSTDAEQLMISVDTTRKRRKKKLDMLAAQMILSAYLDARARD